MTRRGLAAHLHLMPDEPRPTRGPGMPVLNDAAEAVTGHILPAVRAILGNDMAGAEPAADGWEQAVTAAVNAVLELVAPDGEPAGLRGPDGKVTIHGPNPNGPGHGDLIFAEADLPTTARAVLSHYTSPAVGMARFDARDGTDVDWALIEARCAMAAATLVAAVARTECRPPAHHLVVDTQPRQPSGAPTGGQYAATARTEPAVDLGPDATPAQAEAVTASAALAGFLDVDPQAITVQFHADTNAPVSLTVFGPVHAVTGEQVFVHVYEHETGHETHVRVDVRYPVNLQGLPWDTDTSAAYLRGVLPTTADALRRLIDEALDGARIASAIDRFVNAAAFEQNQRATFPDEWYTLPRVTVKKAGSQPVLHLELNGDASQSVELEVRRDDGVVTAAVLRTPFGLVRLTGDEHLDTVLGAVDTELARAAGNPTSTGTRDGLNARLLAVFRHVDR